MNHKVRGGGDNIDCDISEGALLKRALTELKNEGFFKFEKNVILPDHGRIPDHDVLVLQDPA